MIKKRILENSGIEVNPVGLGCMGFSHAYGTPTDKSDAIKLIRNSYDMGYDFLTQRRHILVLTVMVLYLRMKNWWARH